MLSREACLGPMLLLLLQALDKEERLTRRESGDKLSVRVRASIKAAS